MMEALMYADSKEKLNARPARRLAFPARAEPAPADDAGFAEVLLELGGEGAGLEIDLGPGASARVAVRFAAAAPARGPLRSSIGVRIADGARLELSSYSALPAGLEHEALLEVRLGTDAAFRMTEVCLDGATGCHRAEIELAGRGAAVDLAGAYAAAGSTAREHEVNLRHAAPGGKGRIDLAAVLAGGSKLRFTGLIHVLPGAAGTDAFLANRNLILDDGARAESLPQLRIEHDEVSCSHGSTSGGLDPEELFYLQSRGLDPAEARSLLAMGRLVAVLARLPAPLAAEAESAAAALILGGEGT